MKQIEKLSLATVSFLQSGLLALYIFLVASLMLNGNRWFGPMNQTPILGPVLFLTLFIFSAIISSSLVLGYPAYLYFVKKDLKSAIKVVVYTTLFLLIFLIIVMVTLLL